MIWYPLSSYCSYAAPFFLTRDRYCTLCHCVVTLPLPHCHYLPLPSRRYRTILFASSADYDMMACMHSLLLAAALVGTLLSCSCLFSSSSNPRIRICVWCWWKLLGNGRQFILIVLFWKQWHCLSNCLAVICVLCSQHMSSFAIDTVRWYPQVVFDALVSYL